MNPERYNVGKHEVRIVGSRNLIGEPSQGNVSLIEMYVVTDTNDVRKRLYACTVSYGKIPLRAEFAGLDIDRAEREK